MGKIYFSINLDSEKFKELEEVAKKKGLSRNNYVKMLVYEHLANT